MVSIGLVDRVDAAILDYHYICLWLFYIILNSMELFQNVKKIIKLI